MQKKIGGLLTTYQDAGEGSDLPLVVLLHGWGCSHAVYKQVTAAVATGYRMVVPDLPGFGETDEPTDAWSMDTYADWVVGFIESFAPKRVILMGHSFGGHLAIKIAARRDLPFAIDRVILTASAGVVRKPSLGSRVRNRLYKVGRGFMSTAPMRRLFPNAIENMFNKRASADYKAASPLMRKIMVNRLNEDLTDVMPGIAAPTLLIWGDRDTATPLENGRLMERLIPGAGLALVQNAGHFCFADQPIVFTRILASFLGLEV